MRHGWNTDKETDKELPSFCLHPCSIRVSSVAQRSSLCDERANVVKDLTSSVKGTINVKDVEGIFDLPGPAKDKRK